MDDARIELVIVPLHHALKARMKDTPNEKGYPLDFLRKSRCIEIMLHRIKSRATTTNTTTVLTPHQTAH